MEEKTLFISQRELGIAFQVTDPSLWGPSAMASQAIPRNCPMGMIFHVESPHCHVVLSRWTEGRGAAPFSLGTSAPPSESGYFLVFFIIII